MTVWTLIRRNLRFHARAHLGVVLGAAIGSAALTGALVVGDSVRESLIETALNRLGPIHFALTTQDRFFGTSLRERLASGTGWARMFRGTIQACDALVLPGIAARQDGAARANRINVLGVSCGRWECLAKWPNLLAESFETVPGEDERDYNRVVVEESRRWQRIVREWERGETALINQALARQLAAHQGDEIILRVRKPSALGLDTAISPRGEETVAIRLKVGAILAPAVLGDFALTAQPSPPANLFLPRQFLSDKLGLHDQANLLIAGVVYADWTRGRWYGVRSQVADWLWRHASHNHAMHYSGPAARLAGLIDPRRMRPRADAACLPGLNADLGRVWLPEDAGLTVREIEQPASATGGEYARPLAELCSARIFLEPAVVAAALKPRSTIITHREGVTGDTPKDVAFAQFVTNGVRVLSYLANLIQAGDRSTPYSMVTAADSPFVPADMRDDEILVNQWLADDLQVKPGDSAALSYYVVDSGSRLVERTNSFRVRRIVPLKGMYADRTLMPEFPGLAKAESTHDWDAGFPLVHPIREKDETYWKAHRGTPKAFVTLAAGQAMWANRFGALTAIRYEVPTNTFASTCREAVYRNLLANLRPDEVGLRFEAVREQALKAAAQAQDFGQLFLGFSIFLVVAALLLMALLFQFGLEQRAGEIGTLLALGFTPRQVRRLFLLEGAMLGLIGSVLGMLGGIAYAKAMLWGLTTTWRSAVGPSALQFHATLATLIVGACAGTVVAVLTMWLTLRKQARQPARELLAGEVSGPWSVVRRLGAWIALASGLAAVVIVGWVLVRGDRANAGAFFGAGALVLVAGLCGAAGWFGRLGTAAGTGRLTLGGLGLRGCARRRKRSLATVALLACGSFLIVAIGVFRLDANRDATKRSSGTGGFALIGDSTMPVVQDLNSKAGREFFALDVAALAGVNVVALRVRAGDEASCLNLSRAQRPRLLGVKPELLAGRFAFANVVKGFDRRQGWDLLRVGGSRPQSALTDKSQIAEVPAIGDANSIQWALGKKVGDTIDYTDEQGRAFKVRLVGAVANSVLQGSLLIDEAEFVRRFPGESGYRMFLLDVPSNSVAQVSATLSRALQDVGLELTPAAERLNAFNAVQNTYLGTFQVLGGLGLLLGSAGLGVVVLRNVLERRGELGLLLAVGFRRRALKRLVLSEHGALLGLGLGLGVAAAAVAVLPAILSPGTQLPCGSLALTLAGVLLNGLLWTWLATGYALRGNLLAALRNE
jgi:putative ABC transport system permease protein